MKNVHIYDTISKDELRETLQDMFPDPKDDDSGWQEEVKARLEKFSKPSSKEKMRTIRRSRIWPWFSIAAIALIVLMLTFWPKQDTTPTARATAAVSETKTDSPKTVDEPKIKKTKRELAKNEALLISVKGMKTNKITRTEAEKDSNATNFAVNGSEVLNEHAYYVSNVAKDTFVYQAPSHMDEFIVKLADFYHVKGYPLDCNLDKKDPRVIGTAYVFEDDGELNLFSRLLLAACKYDDKTPGYLLNFSHQQLFFCLKDVRLGLKYLWIAERINDKILLYSTHSPIDIKVSSECFRKYRDKLTNINIHQKSIEI